jgi:hypothetical protein
MILIESESMLEREISDIKKVLPASHLNLQGYGGLAFQCGCKEAHLVNGMDGAKPLFTTLPVKVLFNCPNGYVAFVHIKGLFSQKAVSIWSCKEELFFNLKN